ncbi:MAG: hypothetical protein NC084_10975 [Bacteroides sp.]|nr:hypothetical protein [Eubacterium sp.]MCM1419394.1 hypothetical protein [Roseburia sp.]MCM1463218.1 hypothetical protein [Bacteroides sp.]
MSKLGFMQDLIRGINKLAKADEPTKKTAVAEATAPAISGSVSSLLKRAALFLEDHDWESATEYCNKVLDLDPECARAYFYMLWAGCKIESESKLESYFFKTFEDIDGYGLKPLGSYQKALRYADPEFRSKLEYYHKRVSYNYAEFLFEKADSFDRYMDAKEIYEDQDLQGFMDVEEKIALCQEKALEYGYDAAQRMFTNAVVPKDFDNAKPLFEKLGDYRDSKEKVKACEIGVLEYQYQQALRTLTGAETPDGFEKARQAFKVLGDYKDSKEKAAESQKGIERVRFNELCARLDAVAVEKNHVAENNHAQERLEKLKREFLDSHYEGSEEKVAECDRRIALAVKMNRNTKRRNKIIAATVAAAVIFAIATPTFILPTINYNSAVKMAEEGRYDEAMTLFLELGEYSDSVDRIKETKYNKAVALVKEKKYNEAIELFQELNEYDDSKNKIEEVKEIRNNEVILLIEAEHYDDIAMILGDEMVVFFRNNPFPNIAVGVSHIAILTSNKTVVAMGNNSNGQCDVSEWKNIVAISAGGAHTVGLKSDGTVVATGSNSHSQCNVSNWTDIVAISAGNTHTSGLKSDGTVVTAGRKAEGDDSENWVGIKKE